MIILRVMYSVTRNNDLCTKGKSKKMILSQFIQGLLVNKDSFEMYAACILYKIILLRCIFFAGKCLQKITPLNCVCMVLSHKMVCTYFFATFLAIARNSVHI